jgi:hypothetical protein
VFNNLKVADIHEKSLTVNQGLHLIKTKSKESFELILKIYLGFYNKQDMTLCLYLIVLNIVFCSITYYLIAKVQSYQKKSIIGYELLSI